MRIDLNADLGESFGNYTIGVDERVIEHISSANIACGFHASDPLVMQKTVEAAKTAGVSVRADSICLHGDNEKAALFAEKLKKN